MGAYRFYLLRPLPHLNGDQMKLAPTLRVLATVATVGLLASACSGGLDESSSATSAASAAATAGASAAATGDTIKIGYVMMMAG